MNLAAVLAGGVGSRMDLGLPKQFYKLAGKTVLEHSVQVFESHPAVDRIVIVMHADYVQQARRLVALNGWKKVADVIAGGATRFDSSEAAVRFFAAAAAEDKLLIHDAARPLVSRAVIDRVLAGLDSYQAVNVGLMPKDTVVEVDGKGLIVATPERSRLMAVQTPQGFRVGILRRAYSLAKGQEQQFTDDCGVVKQMLPEVQIKVVAGDVRNQKLTVREDLVFFESQIRVQAQNLN